MFKTSIPEPVQALVHALTFLPCFPTALFQSWPPAFVVYTLVEQNILFSIPLATVIQAGYVPGLVLMLGIGSYIVSAPLRVHTRAKMAITMVREA